MLALPFKQMVVINIYFDFEQCQRFDIKGVLFFNNAKFGLCEIRVFPIGIQVFSAGTETFEILAKTCIRTMFSAGTEHLNYDWKNTYFRNLTFESLVNVHLN